LRQSKLNLRPMAAVSGVGAALRRPRHSRSRWVKGVTGSVDSCSVEGAGGEVASLSKKEKEVLIGGGLVGVVSVGVVSVGGGARLKRASRGWTSFEPSFGSVVDVDVVVSGVGLEAALVTAGEALTAFSFSPGASDSDSDSSSVSAASESESSSSDELDTTLESSSSSELSDSGGGGAFFFFSFWAGAAAGFFTMGRPCESVGGGSFSGCPSTSCSTRLCAAFLVSGSTTAPSSSTQPTPSI